ncbi:MULTISPECIES: hypothetical protein [Pseudomonas]|nr:MULTISPECIES: hypothetical protein [Pseudomonas]
MAAWLLWLCPYLFRRPGTISLFVVVVAFLLDRFSPFFEHSFHAAIAG